MEDMFVVSWQIPLRKATSKSLSEGSTYQSMTFSGIKCNQLSAPCHIVIGDRGKGACKDD